MDIDPDTLPLASKGPRRPPPKLKGPVASVAEQVASWPGVIACTHWHLHRRNEPNGVDFYVGERELGHIHLDGELHLATSALLRSTLVARKFARPFPWYERWVEYSINTDGSGVHGLWLLHLNYRRLCGDDEALLVQEIDQHPLLITN